ncbi:unnamed protein product [Paramecium pentaurelia]|uniref:Replication protein A C-terminal domain-containing protein n=1 Tax=Paramecium pentaurelia TaxID=43138 RepID=A0A8S1SQM9_9CILI|nr:unnamed protein product [Paramecium pentaurelia]
MFQQSQFSEQKNQSAYKQGINYNEQITNMTIKMMKRLKISTIDKNEILYQDKQITLIQIVARASKISEQQNKASIVINDDSGSETLTLLLSESNQIKEMYQIFEKEEELNTNYFQFLLRTRIQKEQIIFDIMNITKLNQVGQVIQHMLNIIQQAIKSNQIKNQIFIQTNTQIVEEEQFKQQQLSLSDKILNYIKQSSETNIPQQNIFNKFSEQYTLQEIKQSIKQLLENGNIQSGQGINNYMLAD